MPKLDPVSIWSVSCHSVSVSIGTNGWKEVYFFQSVSQVKRSIGRYQSEKANPPITKKPKGCRLLSNIDCLVAAKPYVLRSKISSHMRVCTMVADGLVFIWRQDTCNHRDDVGWPVRLRIAQRTNEMDGFLQHCSNCSALAMELLQFCTKPSKWYHPKSIH